MHDLDRILHACSSSAALPIAMATVVRTHGSTFRRPGARMFVTMKGNVVGGVSGGCLERDVVERGNEVIATGIPSLMSFDTRQALGCDGVVDVFVERLSPAGGGSDLRDALARRSLDRESCVVVTVFEADGPDAPQPGTYCLGGVAAVALPLEVQRDADCALESGRSTGCSYDWGACFIDVIRPPTRVVIIGARYDAVPLARLSRSLGWEVCAVNHPADNGRAEGLDELAECITLRPEELSNALPMDGSTAVVLMTHRFGHDAAYLNALMPLQFPYLGLLGPRKRRDQILAALLEALPRAGMETLDSAALLKLRSPAGLDIGSETPEEIALSITAEIQAVLAGRTGMPLRDCGGPIHGTTPRRETMKPRAARQDVAAIVLAAGGSSRLGMPKQMVRYQGKTLIRRAAETAIASGCWPVVVVLGAGEVECGSELEDLPVRLVSNPEWESGMASSIRRGLEGAESKGQRPAAALLCLCDQPRVTAEMLREIIVMHEHSGARIVASGYDGTLGAPALFDASLFPELLALTGDAGARKLFKQFADEVVVVPQPEAGIDVDTPADHQRLTSESHLAALA